MVIDQYQQRSGSAKKREPSQTLLLGHDTAPLGQQTPASVATVGAIALHRTLICNQCGKKTYLRDQQQRNNDSVPIENQVAAAVFCETCGMTGYCNAKCMARDRRFHVLECQPDDVIKQMRSSSVANPEVTFVSDESS